MLAHLKTHIHVTLLRDPVDCWESNYVYMGLQNAFKMDINEFAASEKVLNSKISSGCDNTPPIVYFLILIEK